MQTEDTFLTQRNSRAALEQSFLPLQVAKRPDVGEGKSKSILVFIADDRAQRKTPVFKTYAATIPVVGCLCGGILHQVELAIKSHVGCGAPAFLAGTAVTEKRAELVENRR